MPACSSQNGCSRVPFDGSRLGPTEEITTNLFFIEGSNQIYCPQITQICTNFLVGRVTPVRAARCQRGVQRTARPTFSYFPDSALQPRRLGGELADK